MRRTAIKPKRLYQLSREFMASQPCPGFNPEGGRPRTYDDSLILAIASIQNLHQFSFREALEFCEDFFPDLPTLSTYHYRLKTFNPRLPRKFIEYLAQKIQKSTSEKVCFFIMDGTGFSYHDAYPMKLYRGLEIRKIRSHLKVAALIASTKKRRFVLSAKAGKAYSSEIKLIEPLLLKNISPPGYVLGDKGFDCIRILQAIRKKKCRAAVAIKKGRLQTIRDPLRIWSKKNADNPAIYNKRTLIEGLFGNVKQKLSSHVRIFKLKIAKIFALLRLALLNVAVLIKLETENQALWIWFSNSARGKGFGIFSASCAIFSLFVFLIAICLTPSLRTSTLLKRVLQQKKNLLKYL